MRNIIITQRSAEELLLSILKEDLKNCEDMLEDWLSTLPPAGYCFEYYHNIVKQYKKDIKTLKRAINFYSVEQPYADV